MPGGDNKRIGRGIALLERLLANCTDASTRRMAESALGLCHLLTYRQNVKEPLPLIGILGSASSGKSTLLNSIAGKNISKVTPIPHQTTGPILATPKGFQENALDPSFLRPLASPVRWATEDGLELSGSPTEATAVPAWQGEHRPFALVDLPDVGTVDAHREKLVALKILPWLDRVILLVTEESFAQADHEQIEDALKLLRPERARAELYVVLNRRHRETTDQQFEERLKTLRGFWSEAAVSTLPHLNDKEFFKEADTKALVAESHLRSLHVLQSALTNLAGEAAASAGNLAAIQKTEKRRMENSTARLIEEGARMRKRFFSPEFKKRLEMFSPWKTSVRKWKTLLGKKETTDTSVVELLAAAPVQRQAERTLGSVRTLLSEHLVKQSASDAQNAAGKLPGIHTDRLNARVKKIVEDTNAMAVKDVETLLNAMQEDRKVKDPVWGGATALFGTLFLLDLAMPSVGTLSTLAVSGILSALGFGGMVTSDLVRKLRTGKLRDSFIKEMKQMLEEEAAPMLKAAFQEGQDLENIAAKLAAWSKETAGV